MHTHTRTCTRTRAACARTHTHIHTHTLSLVFIHTDLSSLKYMIVIKVNTHKANPYKSYTNSIVIY